jgi:excisionase family DNA binding protein
MPDFDVDSVEFLTLTEAAALMRVSVSTIRAMCIAGRLSGARKFGGVWRIHKMAFLESIGCAEKSYVNHDAESMANASEL